MHAYIHMSRHAYIQWTNRCNANCIDIYTYTVCIYIRKHGVQIDCNAMQCNANTLQNNVCRFCLQWYLQKYIHMYIQTYTANYACTRSKVIKTLCYIQNNVNRS